MKKLSMINFCCLFIAVSIMLCAFNYRHGLAVTTQGDAPSFNQTAPMPPKVVRHDGWPIPGVRKFTVVANVQEMEIEGTKVRRKKLQSTTEPLVDLEGYSVGKDGEILIKTIPCAVRYLFAYEANGHLFSYETVFIGTKVYRDGTRESTGASYTVFYYDEDGNGSFEARYSTGTLAKLPDWVKVSKKGSGVNLKTD